ncbi:THUMP domain-containing protein [Bdellovibrionota bacterium FG-2]
MTTPHSFFATTAKGMESLLASELTEFGASDITPTRAGVSFKGPLQIAYRACLWSRIANRVLLPLKTFPAPTPEKLYGGAKAIRWSDHITPQLTFSVDFSSTDSAITHTHFGALKVKDALVDQLRSVQGSRPDVDSVNPNIRINVYLYQDVATVSLDLSGESLHRRGYREQGTPAPLKENLAAAILALANWKEVLKTDAAFLDPMCGSGTLPIEAALIAARRAPGLHRETYGFTHWLGHKPLIWKQLLEEAHDLEIHDKKLLPTIVGYDEDFKAVRVALANVERAGLRNRVHIEKCSLAECEPIAESGIIILNPPYGERLGETEALKPLYQSIGDTFKKKFSGWSGFVFTGSRELSHEIGLRPKRRHVLYNGALECRLLQYELYKGSHDTKEKKAEQETFVS